MFNVKYQEKHHEKKTFREELKEMLEENGVESDGYRIEEELVLIFNHFVVERLVLGLYSGTIPSGLYPDNWLSKPEGVVVNRLIVKMKPLIFILLHIVK